MKTKQKNKIKPYLNTAKTKRLQKEPSTKKVQQLDEKQNKKIKQTLPQ